MGLPGSWPGVLAEGQDGEPPNFKSGGVCLAPDSRHRLVNVLVIGVEIAISPTIGECRRESESGCA